MEKIAKCFMPQSGTCMSLLDNLHACGAEVNNRLGSRKASVRKNYKMLRASGTCMSLLNNLHACGVEVDNRLGSRKASVRKKLQNASYLRYVHVTTR